MTRIMPELSFFLNKLFFVVEEDGDSKFRAKDKMDA